MNEEQREKLRGYAAQKDRRPEPVFVGRNDLFDVVRENIRGAISAGNSTGSTVCITGPAGVGKTAFVEALKARCREEGFEGTRTHCVEIPGSDLHSPGCVIASLANAVPEFQFGEAVKGQLSAVGISVLGTGGSLSWDRAAPPPPFSSFPAQLFREGAEELLNRGNAFILVVDEAQAIAPTLGRDTNALLAHLHQGVDLPIVPVLAGLPNTQENLRETISRFSYGNEPFMVGLSDGESRNYVEKMLEWLEVEGSPGQHRALADWMVKECGAGREGSQCGGWPHHLSNAMKAVAESLLAVGSMRLSDLNGAAVEKSLASRRVQYYRSRFRSQKELALCKGPTLAILKSVRGDAHPIPEHQMPERVFDEFKRKEWGFSSSDPGVSSVQFHDALVMSGLLAQRELESGKSEWICPIPSMARYIEFGEHDFSAPFPQLIDEGEPAASG